MLSRAQHFKCCASTIPPPGLQPIGLKLYNARTRLWKCIFFLAKSLYTRRMFQKKYSVVGLGGTFDHFHAGHRFFLDFATNLGEELKVGVATTRLTQIKMFADQIEPYEARVEAVQ